MAGEWIKFESSLPDKPETLAITAAMGWDDPDLTVGKLMRVFRWFDQQTIDGNARGVTPALLDRLIGVTGFVQAMANERWVTVTEAGLTLRNFNRHNGASAKSRAKTAKRVANHRAEHQSDQELSGCNAATVTPALAREEKRREEKNTKREVPREARGPRPTRKCPEDFDVTAEMREWAEREAPHVDVDRETPKLRDHTFKTAISDWPGAWRNWIRRAAEGRQKAQAPPETAYQRSTRERMNQLTGGLASAKPPEQTAEIIDVTTRRLG